MQKKNSCRRDAFGPLAVLAEPQTAGCLRSSGKFGKTPAWQDENAHALGVRQTIVTMPSTVIYTQ